MSRVLRGLDARLTQQLLSFTPIYREALCFRRLTGDPVTPGEWAYLEDLERKVAELDGVTLIIEETV